MRLMIDFYNLALMGRRLNISCVNDPDTYKQEAWKYAKMFGDHYIHRYNKCIN